MSHPPKTVPDFLRHIKSKFPELLTNGKITFVAGNQSADLDSMCSAILYSYLTTVVSDAKESSSSTNYVPLLHIPREDIDIRPEFQRLFKRVKIEPDSLITLSDLPGLDNIQKELPPERTQWVLVDHNKLEGELGEIYADRVRGAIDHHVDEHAVPASAKPRRIEVCGSCSSLVIDYLRKTWDNAGEDLHKVSDATIAQLALGPILIDTKNMTDAHKVRPVDESSEQYCEKLVNGSYGVPNWDQNAFFQELFEAKQSVGDLPIDGILRKDYKEWKEAETLLGISSVIKPFSFLASKISSDSKEPAQTWSQVAQGFIRPRNLDLWAVMTSFVDPESDQFSRELYVQWTSEQTGAIVRHFEEHNAAQLQLKSKRVDNIEAKNSRLWQQGNTNASRKQVGPLLRQAILDGTQSAGAAKI